MGFKSQTLFQGLVWKLGTVTDITMYQHTEQMLISRPVSLGLEASVAFLFSLLIFSCSKQMRIKLVDQILWYLKAWINILLGIATSLIKGKLKSQFTKSPHLNLFYLYSVWCNLKSQTHTNKHRASGFCFLFLFLPLWLPGSYLLCLQCRRVTFFRAALNEDRSWCADTHLSHPYDEITWRPVLYTGSQSLLGWIMLRLPSGAAGLIKHTSFLYFLSCLSCYLTISVSFTPKNYLKTESSVRVSFWKNPNCTVTSRTQWACF